LAWVKEIRSLGDIPRHYGRERPDADALIFEDRRTTFAEWDRRTNRTANALVKSGVTPQARVAWLGRNSDIYFDLLMGAAKAGAVMTPLNWRLAAPELAVIIEDSEARMVFVEEDFLETAESIWSGLPSVSAWITVGAARPGWISFEAWLDNSSETDPAIPVDPNDPVLQAYTSGTTGRPKGVVLSSRAFYGIEEFAARNPDARDPEVNFTDWSLGDLSLVCMPVFHATGSGWGIAVLYGGATAVIHPQYTVEAVIEAFQSHRITRLVLVPTAIQQLLRHPRSRDLDFTSVQQLIYGASPIPLDLLREAVDRMGCGFVQSYGMTETTGGATFLSESDHRLADGPRMRSAGRVLPGVTITIRDPDGEILPAGQIGEVCIETPNMMSGYWKQPEETARTITAAGYLRSGDAGYLDEDGYLYIKDRIKDMIITGGENVYPAEVESAMFGHPDIEEVAVIGVPDGRWGEAVKAVIVPKPGVTPDAAAILAYTRQRVAGYKTPKSIDFVGALPKNATGKVLRRELRTEYWKGFERQVN
jgi:acyl-CoA synthetase (AMP-forming)/AMP-acid ligase II